MTDLIVRSVVRGAVVVVVCRVKTLRGTVVRGGVVGVVGVVTLVSVVGGVVVVVLVVVVLAIAAIAVLFSHMDSVPYRSPVVLWPVEGLSTPRDLQAWPWAIRLAVRALWGRSPGLVRALLKANKRTWAVVL